MIKKITKTDVETLPLSSSFWQTPYWSMFCHKDKGYSSYFYRNMNNLNEFAYFYTTRSGLVIARDVEISGVRYFLDTIRKRKLFSGVKEVYFANVGRDSIAVEVPDVCLLDSDTLLIDLSKDEDKLLSSYDRSVRKNIKKCKDRGVRVAFLLDGKTLDDVYLPMLRYKRSQMGFDLPFLYPCRKVLSFFPRELFKIGAAVVYCDGQPAAGLGFIGYGDKITELGVAVSEYGERQGLPFHDLIKHELAVYAKKTGYRWYDLGGVQPLSTDPKMQGIFKFKSKFSNEMRSSVGFSCQFAKWRRYLALFYGAKKFLLAKLFHTIDGH